MSSITGRLRSVHDPARARRSCGAAARRHRLRQQRQQQRRLGRRGGGSADLSAAKQLSTESATRPTEITQSKPIDKPIPTGKKITFISCGVEACAVQGPILAEGAKLLGWSVKQVGTDGSPEKVQNAFQSAIRDGANAVIINAADKDALARPISAAKPRRRRVRDVLLARAAGQGRPVQHRHAGAERPDRRDARRQGRRRQRRQGRRAVRQRLGVRDPRGRRPDVRAGVQGALRRLRVRQDRHPADVARQGRAGPHRVLPAQPPEGQLHRRCRRAARSARACPRRCRPPASPTRSRSSARAATSRSTRTSAPARSPPSRPRRSTATTTRCSTRSPASGPASRSSRPRRSSGS